MKVPSLGGTLPDYVFTRSLSAPPIISCANENMKVECFDAGVRTTLCLIEGVAKTAP